MFARAKTVVAPHGTGLANILWAEDSAVLELFSPRIKSCYYHIAETLDI
jgi:capsular polysaccharide biosynthesis protein